MSLVLNESEKAVVKALITGNKENQEYIVSELVEEDLEQYNCVKLYRACKDLLEENLTPNPISAMERAGLSQDSVNQILEVIEPDQGLKTLIYEIKRVASLRRIQKACSGALTNLKGASSPSEVMESLEKDLIRVESTGSVEPDDGESLLKDAQKSFMDRFSTGGGPTVSTGLSELDRAILGLRGGRLYVAAARPGMGKSALMGTITRSVLEQGLGVITFSLEMAKEEVLERELAVKAKVDLRKVISAKNIDSEELSRIHGVQIPEGLWFVDDRTFSIGSMRRKARIISRRMARAGRKLGLVVLDYIQLAGDNGESREQSVSAISRGCKLMAKELDCSVLALSQLNRNCELREDRRPLMSDIRESGAIEQDADVIIMIYRDSVYNEGVDKSEAELIIRKQRSGPTGTVYVKYDPKLVLFYDKPQLRGSHEEGNEAGSQGGVAEVPGED